MAVQVVGTEYTVTGTAASVSSILGVSGAGRFISHMTFRALDTNVGNVFLGKSDVTTTTNRLVFLKPGESFSFGLEGPYTNLDDWYVIGTAADKLHIIGLT